MKKVLFITVSIAIALGPSATAGALAADGPNSTVTAAKAARLAAVQAKADTAVKNRVSQLETLKSQIDSNKYVTSTHKTELLNEISSDESGLTALDAQIQADSEVTTAVADAKKIVDDYRIYVLEVPKVHEVLAIDTVASIDSKFQAASPKLTAALNAAQNKGKDVSAAQSALTDLNSKATSVNEADLNLAGPVLALQPSNYPTSQTTIKSTRQTLGSMTNELKAARVDLKTITSALK